MLYDISLLILVFSVLFNIAMIQSSITAADKYHDLVSDYNILMINYEIVMINYEIAENNIKELKQLLRDQYIKNQFNNTFIRSSDTTINNDIIQDALKIAMIQSHPDNGGCAEEFIRFKDALDKLKS